MTKLYSLGVYHDYDFEKNKTNYFHHLLDFLRQAQDKY